MLHATDRCDRCGAQAYVATEHDTLILLWCNHCSRKNAAMLDAHIVLDQRAQLAAAKV